MRGLLLIAFAASLANAQLDQKTSKENMVRERGEVPVFRGSNPVTVYGTLIDAACKDRSALNLATPPESLTAAMPVETPAESQAAKAKPGPGGVSSHGITVNAKTLSAERSDVVAHMAPDLFTRQADPTCAITAGTTGYAVFLDDGRLLNLDQGGNTFASDAVVISKAGRAMLNGTAYGFKPRVKINGRVRGDRIEVSDLALQ